MATWRPAGEPTLTCKGYERVTSRVEQIYPENCGFKLVYILLITPDKSRNNFLHAQTMTSAILFESRTIILATVQRNWQCISWLYIGSIKEFHVTGYTSVSNNMGAFRCIHARNPSSPSWLNEVKVDLNGHCALIG